MVSCTLRRYPWSLGPILALVIVMGWGAQTTLGQQAESEEPELSLRATPRVGFPPLDVLFIGELRGGSDDHEELYCASIEWDWADDTRSESIPDCDPYEPGVSEIRRRYSMRHTFQQGGIYEVRLNLKKGDDVVSSARTRVEIRGSADGFR